MNQRVVKGVALLVKDYLQDRWDIIKYKALEREEQGLPDAEILERRKQRIREFKALPPPANLYKGWELKIDLEGVEKLDKEEVEKIAHERVSKALEVATFDSLPPLNND